VPHNLQTMSSTRATNHPLCVPVARIVDRPPARRSLLPFLAFGLPDRAIFPGSARS
jgi:hypothetical protein